jgi:hypothetical protein
MLTTTLTIRTDEALREALQKQADVQGNTVSELAREILAEAVAERPLAESIGHLRGQLDLAPGDSDPWRGSILLTPVAVIPESQLWTVEEPHRSAIARGMAWMAENPAAETDLDELLDGRDRRPVAKPQKRSRASAK